MTPPWAIVTAFSFGPFVLCVLLLVERFTVRRLL